jgi:hypothetical protein
MAPLREFNGTISGKAPQTKAADDGKTVVTSGG